MRIAIFGLGYVGATAACCLASQGHHVLGIDSNPHKVANFNDGIAPIVEPGLASLMHNGLQAGLLRAATTPRGNLHDIDLAMVCVGTPSAPDGAHNMRHIVEVSREIAAEIAPGRSTPLTVAYRSTIRPGTIENLVLPIFRQALGDDLSRLVELIYNPEFLREASGVHDFFHPPKIVVGTIDGQPSATMDKLHAGLTVPAFTVPFREAEFTKFLDNSWHANKVAFANEIGRLCEHLGISAATVHQIFVSDTKLNISPSYTRPGGAFGGSCLPKDVRAFQHMSADVGANTPLLDTLLRTNEAHKHFQFQRIVQRLPPGGRVLLVGLAFKSGTDDLRESPNVDLARRLLAAGYYLSVYDPGLDPARLFGQNLGYAYAHLPTIADLLIDRCAAETIAFDLVIAANASIADIAVSAPIIDIGAIA